MKLFNKISPKISSAILLFSFLGIYMINFGCSIANIADNINLFSQVEENHNHGNHHHGDHDHGDGHHHNTKEDSKSNEEDDGCCGDESSTYFASIQVFPTIQANYDFTPSSIALLSFGSIDNYDFNLYSNTLTDNRPPPDILAQTLDIRTTIQSFQI